MGHYLFLYLYNSINKKEFFFQKSEKEGSFYSKESKHLEYFDYLSFYNNVCNHCCCLLLREKKKERIFLIKDFNTKRYKLCLKGVI